MEPAVVRSKLCSSASACLGVFARIAMSSVWSASVLVIVCAGYLLLVPDIGLGVRVFTYGPGDLGSIPGRVIPKTQKMVLDASLLNTKHYKIRIKCKVEQSREGVAPSPTPWCSSYRKGSLRVTLDYGRQLYFFFYYLLLLFFVMSKPFSLILSIDVLST